MGFYSIACLLLLVQNVQQLWFYRLFFWHWSCVLALEFFFWVQIQGLGRKRSLSTLGGILFWLLFFCLSLDLIPGFLVLSWSLLLYWNQFVFPVSLVALLLVFVTWSGLLRKPFPSHSLFHIFTYPTIAEVNTSFLQSRLYPPRFYLTLILCWYF